MYIRPATRKDLANIATVASRAMMTDELSLWLSPEQTQNKHLHRERCLRTTIRRWNAGLIMLVMVLDSSDAEYRGKEQILGYAAFEKKVGAPDDSEHVRNSIWDKFERLAHTWQDNYIWYFRNNLGTLKDRAAVLVDELATNEAMSQFDRYWELDILCVDPAFFRRGIGSKLIAWGQERAAEDQVPFWLWSSAIGEPLYRRHGFVDSGRLKFDHLDVPVLVWKPESIR